MVASAVQAQESSGVERDRQGIIEEILVTARKREESLFEIPESVAAIAGDDINRENLRTLDDIGLRVPNLNLATRLDGFPNVSIRGLGAFGNTQGVGFYLDDVQVFSDALITLWRLGAHRDPQRAPRHAVRRQQHWRRHQVSSALGRIRTRPLAASSCRLASNPARCGGERQRALGEQLGHAPVRLRRRA